MFSSSYDDFFSFRTKQLTFSRLVYCIFWFTFRSEFSSRQFILYLQYMQQCSITRGDWIFRGWLYKGSGVVVDVLLQWVTVTERRPLHRHTHTQSAFCDHSLTTLPPLLVQHLYCVCIIIMLYDLWNVRSFWRHACRIKQTETTEVKFCGQIGGLSTKILQTMTSLNI